MNNKFTFSRLLIRSARIFRNAIDSINIYIDTNISNLAKMPNLLNRLNDFKEDCLLFALGLETSAAIGSIENLSNITQHIVASTKEIAGRIEDSDALESGEYYNQFLEFLSDLKQLTEDIITVDTKKIKSKVDDLFDLEVC